MKLPSVTEVPEDPEIPQAIQIIESSGLVVLPAGTINLAATVQNVLPNIPWGWCVEMARWQLLAQAGGESKDCRP